ncbi:uncharacterized protein [Triticum aestivum]|uniref:uncharacterized protein isoform X2 n=1 Tax=Triticum aestivum TaxID=4565 RepID=UPI001D00FC7B|nr:uncharacterized protein LOC123121952 isoform X2 [Triticum aestivum]
MDEEARASEAGARKQRVLPEGAPTCQIFQLIGPGKVKMLDPAVAGIPYRRRMACMTYDQKINRQMEQDGVTIPVWRRSRVLASGLHFLLPLIFKKEDSATRLKGYYAQFSHPSQVSQKHKHAWMCVLAGDLAVSNPSVWTGSLLSSHRVYWCSISYPLSKR